MTFTFKTVQSPSLKDPEAQFSLISSETTNLIKAVNKHCGVDVLERFGGGYSQTAKLLNKDAWVRMIVPHVIGPDNSQTYTLTLPNT